MVVFNLAFTAPINPADAPVQLTVPQLWAGLQRKIRFAQEFVPAIVACEVLEEKPDEVTRQVVFKEWPDKKVKEVCRSYEPARVDFHQEDNSVVSNIISNGARGELYMTYSFSWNHPEIEAGSAQEKEWLDKRRSVGQMAVEKSIESIRAMVQDGRIK